MNIEALIDRIVEMTSTKTVIGEPVQVGEITLIPVVNVCFGFGAGGGESSPSTNEHGSGSGGGGGARLKAAGVLVIKGGEVSFIPTTAKGGSFDKLMDSIPELLAKVKIQTGGKAKEKDGEQA